MLIVNNRVLITAAGVIVTGWVLIITAGVNCYWPVLFIKGNFFAKVLIVANCLQGC